MVTALEAAQALGYFLLVAGFVLWVTLSSAGRVNGNGTRRRTPTTRRSRSSRGTCATRRPSRRRP